MRRSISWSWRWLRETVSVIGAGIAFSPTATVQNLRRYNRPILCTEYMSRGNGSFFDPQAIPPGDDEAIADAAQKVIHHLQTDPDAFANAVGNAGTGGLTKTGAFRGAIQDPDFRAHGGYLRPGVPTVVGERVVDEHRLTVLGHPAGEALADGDLHAGGGDCVPVERPVVPDLVRRAPRARRPGPARPDLARRRHLRRRHRCARDTVVPFDGHRTERMDQTSGDVAADANDFPRAVSETVCVGSITAPAWR